jgi:hypothetical protein
VWILVLKQKLDLMRKVNPQSQSWFDVPVVKYVAIHPRVQQTKRCRRFRFAHIHCLAASLDSVSWEFHSWFVQEAGKVAHPCRPLELQGRKVIGIDPEHFRFRQQIAAFWFGGITQHLCR